VFSGGFFEGFESVRGDFRDGLSVRSGGTGGFGREIRLVLLSVLVRKTVLQNEAFTATA
jgi:hypothetical protein